MNLSHRLLIAAAGVGAAASTVTATAFGAVTAYDVVAARTPAVASVQSPATATQPLPSMPSSGSGRSRSNGWGGQGLPQTVPGQGLDGSIGSSGSVGAVGEASAEQVRGVVDIATTVSYGQGQAAGTGIVLTSTGRILTNNHVIEDSTAITVTDLTSGRRYTADVVGTSPTNDIAVLQLEDASGLTPATLGDSDTVAIGDAVTGVGNAGNAAGTSAATGTVTALGESITASDQGGSNAEHLTGLIETDAGIQAGDSGGPLYDAQGKVVGIDTAAQTSGRSGPTVAGYAVPINHALDVAEQIVAGVDDEVIHQGVPAFLGVQMSQSGSFGDSSGAGVTIAGTVDGSAAAQAGLVAGDRITSLGGQPVTSADSLRSIVAALNPGTSVHLEWEDGSGQGHSASVTLGAGPAD